MLEDIRSHFPSAGTILTFFERFLYQAYFYYILSQKMGLPTNYREKNTKNNIF